jgi:hypothetical protein
MKAVDVQDNFCTRVAHAAVSANPTAAETVLEPSILRPSPTCKSVLVFTRIGDFKRASATISFPRGVKGLGLRGVTAIAIL